ncbi:hypothetical protein NMCA_09640 [Enterobacter ludwigii]|nr:hypothetical protein NMCA_09640 [Enterobacter ludwigii]
MITEEYCKKISGRDLKNAWDKKDLLTNFTRKFSNVSDNYVKKYKYIILLRNCMLFVHVKQLSLHFLACKMYKCINEMLGCIKFITLIESIFGY